MYPEDRVLVAIMNNQRDFAIARDQGWYRIPVKHAPEKALEFEALAFYFTKAFGSQKWAIHYWARIQGHELATRRQLLPEESDHPHADERYYKLQFGPLQPKEPPIVSKRWRRITFLLTTWDRFQDATEINDLYTKGGPYVDRMYIALRDAGMAPERGYHIRERGVRYEVDLVIPCRGGFLPVVVGDVPAPGTALRFTEETLDSDWPDCLAVMESAIRDWGGPLPPDTPIV